MTDSADTMMLTTFLKNQHDKNLAEINAKFKTTEFLEGLSTRWRRTLQLVRMMGIGQVVTLRLPASRLREVNFAMEQRAWGAFETEFYATYDFRPVWENLKAQSA